MPFLVFVGLIKLGLSFRISGKPILVVMRILHKLRKLIFLPISNMKARLNKLRIRALSDFIMPAS